MTNQTGSSLKFERTYNARVAKVFEALTSKAAIAKWFGPSDDIAVTVHTWDCEVGGQYRVQFDTPDGEQHICIGEFREIVANEKLSYCPNRLFHPALKSTFRQPLGNTDGAAHRPLVAS